MDEGGAEEESELKQNFTPIHEKKRLPQPICVASLCPTMDLAAIGLRKKASASASAAAAALASTIGISAAASVDNNKINHTNESDDDSTKLIQILCSNSITVYRTISWQKMFVVNQTDLSNALSSKNILDDGNYSNKNETSNKDGSGSGSGSGNNNDDDGDDGGNNNSSNSDDNQPSSVSQLTWSPDGRTLALGLNNGSTLLYDIESSASPGVPPKPVVYIPSPPLTTTNSLLIFNGKEKIEKKHDSIEKSLPLPSSSLVSPTGTQITEKSTNTLTPTYSPAVTRSMAAARRKKVIQMLGREPESDSGNNHKEGSKPIGLDTDNTITSVTEPLSPSSFSSSPTTSKIQRLKTQLNSRKNAIVALQWQRINPVYKDWDITTEEQNEEESWNFQSHYLDKATHFLPPCAYNSTYPVNFNVYDDGYGYTGNSVGIGAGTNGGTNGSGGSRQMSENLDHHHNDFEESVDPYRPKCQTPLSVLISATCGNGIHLYLQGRYRILSVPSPIALCNRSTSVTAFSDLSNVLICTKSVNNETFQNTTALVLYSIPAMTKNRYKLQIISSSYCSIMSHFTTLHEGTKETCSAWNGSLRQLDMKFDQLSTFLTKYGVMPSEGCNTVIDKMTIVRMELLNYILGGHSKRSTDTSNAMDQFFTTQSLHDQLLQRLIRSLEANVAGVEGILRKKILGPVRALMYDVGELHGLVKVMNVECSGYDYDLQEDEGEVDHLPLMNEHTSLRLYEASEVLFFVAEQCVSQLVEIRFRLSCMMKWMRATASQVRARGTAMDSVQRENAKKRRVPEQIVRKIADFLSTTLKSEKDENDPIKRGASECILGVLFSDYFCKDKVNIEAPPTPLNSNNMNNRLHDNDRNKHIESPSVKAALEISTQIALDLFEEPRVAMRKTVSQTSIALDECANDLPTDQIITAVHNRIGAAPHSAPNVENCFNPNILPTHDNEDNTQYCSRHWTIMANSCSSKMDGLHMLQISALPENKSMLDFEDLEQDISEIENLFYLTTFIALPMDCQITNIKFYGDDGNSTLTSETSSNSEEGNQAMGLMLRKNTGENTFVEELWLFHYDDLDFRVVNLQPHDDSNNHIQIYKFDANHDSFCMLITLNDTLNEDDESKNGAICAKCESRYILLLITILFI
jgi:hypothetical protein